MSRKKSLFLIFLNILCVAAQNFSNAPCLGIATTAGMRGITVKNFGNRTNAALFQKVGLYRCKICHCLFFCFRRVVVDFHVSGQKAAHQKSPCGSLMVSGISFRKRATVDPVIVFVFRREGAYAGDNTNGTSRLTINITIVINFGWYKKLTTIKSLQLY